MATQTPSIVPPGIFSWGAGGGGGIVEVPGPAGPPGPTGPAILEVVAALMPAGKYEVPQDLHGNS